MPTTTGYRTKADIAVFQDVTGSMDWCVGELGKNICKLAEDLAHASVDWRLAYCAFRDEKAGQSPEFHDFTTDIADVQRWVDDQEAYGGGGNGGESTVDALREGLKRFSFRDTATRVFLLFTDEPPHDPDASGDTVEDLVRDLRAQRVLTFVVSKPHPKLVLLASSTGGLHFDIETARGEFRKILGILGASISTVSPGAEAIAHAATAAITHPSLGATRVLDKIPDDPPPHR